MLWGTNLFTTTAVPRGNTHRRTGTRIYYTTPKGEQIEAEPNVLALLYFLFCYRWLLLPSCLASLLRIVATTHSAYQTIGGSEKVDGRFSVRNHKALQKEAIRKKEGEEEEQ